MVTCEIFDAVLALAMGIICWVAKNVHFTIASVFVVRVHVLDSDHHRRL